MMKLLYISFFVAALCVSMSMEAKSHKYKSLERRNPKRDDSLRSTDMKFPDKFGYTPRKAQKKESS